VIGPSDYPGISGTVWGSDGSKADAVSMNHTLDEYRRGDAPWPTLRQEGQTVFRWAVWDMAKVAKQALEAAGVTSDQLGEHAHHRRVREAIEASRNRGDRPRHRHHR
jgi:3-oxoacyl-[acyl-carrier-protein] synthase-3